MDLTVACVLRSGGQYHAGHVRGLMAQVETWLPEARFVCLSDVPVPCERIELVSDWPGWWAKLELFQHLKGRTLYLDLDSVIVGNPLPLVTGRFTMIKNWLDPRLRASGVMSWAGDYSHITKQFAPIAQRVMEAYVTSVRWGDQAFIAERAGRVDTFRPGMVVSYRYQQHYFRRGKPPNGARVVAFNGTCVPWEGPEWARCWWEEKEAA
jgi:hypothetical protein